MGVQEPFTDAVAQKLSARAAAAGQKLILISDIRTADWLRDDPEEHDGLILRDMQRQRHWVEIMRPECALLKFRLPYSAGQTEYLAGELRLPVWGPQTTTECRLVVRRSAFGPEFPTQFYDHSVLSEQLFYFNTVARVSIHPRIMQVADDCEELRMESALRSVGLDRCFDCSREV